MKKAKCIADREFVISDIDENIFGSFIEHLGRAIYSGIYEPDHPLADEHGFRKDVLQLVRELNVPIIRYPGGNFLSGYNWTDGIGPAANRPVRLDLAWQSVEPNLIGIDEFVDWAQKANAQVMAAVNLGTGTPQDAGYMVEYCNHPEGTYWSDLRIENGHKDPHQIHVWCLGNEMDGPWQICQLSSEDYGKKAREAAKIMKWVDPSIKLVACGSSTTTMPTYPQWDREVLEYLYDHIDYLSLHRYYENEGNVTDFLGSFADMDRFIKTIGGIIDYVKVKNRSSKDVYLSFDEWNVWYQKKQTRFAWKTAPPILEDNYSLLDALVFGGMLCTLLNNSDRVKMACLAQLVNVIAPIFTQKGGGVLKQTIYYPFEQVSRYGRGQALKALVRSPMIESALYGDIPLLQSAVTYHENENSLTLFALNCDQSEPIELALDLRSFPNATPVNWFVMTGDDLDARNTFEHPDNIVPQEIRVTGITEKKGKHAILIPKLSWNVIRFSAVDDK